MELKGKKVLVTGASGFIGSHLVEELVRRGANVRAFVKNNSSNNIGSLEKLTEDISEKVEIVFGDIQNRENVKRAVYEMNLVFHLGALISVADSYKNPREYMDVNAIGTLNILEASREYKIEKIIIASTSEVYGNGGNKIINEDFPLNPRSPYAASKIAAEKITESFYYSYNLPVSIIRLFNVFGPRQSINPLIPAVINHGIRNEKIQITDLNSKRDFVYVADAVDAFIKTAESDKSNGETINIGTGTASSVKMILEILSKILEKDLFKYVELGNLKNKDEKLLICDNKKAKKLLNWEPKYSLEEGLSKSVDYFKENY